MRRKRGNTNIRILQSQIQKFALAEDAKLYDNDKATNKETRPAPPANKELPVVEKIKKKGVKKDELISTRRLLTM